MLTLIACSGDTADWSLCLHLYNYYNILYPDADLVMITDHPNDTTVNENEVATFSCTATGSGDLTVEWDVGDKRYNMDNCTPLENGCNITNITDNTGDSVTSTLKITAMVNNSVTCVVKQDLSSSTISFGQPVVGVESRTPPIRMLSSQPAQLTVNEAPTTTQPEHSQSVTSTGDQTNTPLAGGKIKLYPRTGNCQL